MADTNEEIQNLDGEIAPALEDNGLVAVPTESDSLLIENVSSEAIIESGENVISAPLIESVGSTSTISNVPVSTGVLADVKQEEVIKTPIIENNSYGNKLVTIKIEEPKLEEKKEIKEIKNDDLASDSEKPVGDLFVNYDSEFHKNEKNIIQKIRLFKMTPKTSISFVLILIVVTFAGIGIMMKIDPKNHSISNYKANVLALVGRSPKIEAPIGTNTGKLLFTNTGDIVTNTGDTSTGLTDSGAIVGTGIVDTSTGIIDEKEEMMLKEKWLTVKPDVITNPDGTTSYLYNGKVYTKDELQDQLKDEVQIEISKKTKDYLNKIYINH